MGKSATFEIFILKMLKRNIEIAELEYKAVEQKIKEMETKRDHRQAS